MDSVTFPEPGGTRSRSPEPGERPMALSLFGLGSGSVPLGPGGGSVPRGRREVRGVPESPGHVVERVHPAMPAAPARHGCVEVRMHRVTVNARVVLE